MGSPLDYSLTFAGAGSRMLPAAGRFCRVLAADASGVHISPSATGSGLLRFEGQDIDAGTTIKEWLVSVTVACTVRVCISDTRQADNATTVNATLSATISPGGTLGNGGDTVCANAAATQLAAGNANGLSVTVKSPLSSTYANGTVRIGTTAVGAASGIELNPGDVFTADTTAPIFAYNGSGAPVTLQVLTLAK